MTELILVRVNCPDRACADLIAERMVSEGLAPCANISGPVGSVYLWEGEIEHAMEWVLLLKARPEHGSMIAARLTELHPSQTPAIIWFPAHCTESYGQWLRDNSELSS